MLAGNTSTSRYSDTALFNAIGQAVRWASLIKLDSCCADFADDAPIADNEAMRAFRVWIYLDESHHQ